MPDEHHQQVATGRCVGGLGGGQAGPAGLLARLQPQVLHPAQLFVCLVLKAFFRTDYRGIAAILADKGVDHEGCFWVYTYAVWDDLALMITVSGD
ncbi:MAG: hypothetical protein BIFFINMI_00477 [Phycisphaerae bacterium]|nr:hypothetical protein [Phycisphaerae bacterium]